MNECVSWGGSDKSPSFTGLESQPGQGSFPGDRTELEVSSGWFPWRQDGSPGVLGVVSLVPACRTVGPAVWRPGSFGVLSAQPASSHSCHCSRDLLARVARPPVSTSHLACLWCPLQPRADGQDPDSAWPLVGLQPSLWVRTASRRSWSGTGLMQSARTRHVATGSPCLCFPAHLHPEIPLSHFSSTSHAHLKPLVIVWDI